MICRKDFIISQHVLLYNFYLRLILRKLRTRWNRPSVITLVYPFGVVDIEDLHTNKRFKVNGHYFKPFHEGLQEHNMILEEVILVEVSYPP